MKFFNYNPFKQSCKMKKILFVSIIALFAMACSQKPKQVESRDSFDLMFHKVVVEEVIQTSQYTYLMVEEKATKYWIAVMKDEYSEGEQLFYFDAKVTPMENFHSQELDRDFDKILFISQVSKEKGEAIQEHATSSAIPHGTVSSGDPHGSMGMPAHSGVKKSDEVGEISVEPVAGGITIAELYANKSKYAGKKVKIRGQVVKVNNQIMGRNWVHLQDGTRNADDYDLTLTTDVVVGVGNVVVLEGVVALDKDFTSGYFYPVIVEEATWVD